MDQKRDELLYSSVKGKNPFKDKRVRQGLLPGHRHRRHQAHVMRGASNPLALMVGPGINGFNPDLNKRLPFDAEASKKLLADAGYPTGFDHRHELPERPLCERRSDLRGRGRQLGSG